MIRRRHRLTSGLFALLVGITACGGGGSVGGSDGEPQRGGSFISGLYLEPLALDPHRQGFWETYRVSRNIFDGLTSEDLSDPKGPVKIVPALATSWNASPDAKNWTFHLRKGVTFHDGSPFNAEALDKNVRRVADPSYRFFDTQSRSRLAAWFNHFTGGKIIDEFTYTFSFSKPELGFPRGLAQSMGTLAIGNPAVWEKYGNDGFAEHPEGTGPYTFVSRKIGDRITLRRNPKYWGGRPNLDELIFRVIPNNQTRLAALLSGEVDQISYVQPDDIETLTKQGFQVPDGTGASYIYFSYNFTNPALRDERVRKALIYGLDRQKLINEVYDGYGVPDYSTFHPGNEAYQPGVKDFAFDTAKATGLLAQSGYGAGKPLRLNLVVDVANTNLAQWLQNQYKKIGVDFTIVSLDRPSYVARIGSPQPDDGFDISEYGGSYAEWLDYVVNSGINGRKGGADVVKTYPDLSGAIDKADNTTDPGTRIARWRDADAILRQKALTIPVFTYTKYYAYSPRVHGFVWPATNGYDLTKVWLSD
ncbi:ABC transporter substrate-binding protein [Gordonia sp. CPCC 205333]|uniref:ABC transporter substrate-binding protein n=1 Tax=Gordonia sp. CPCC 205333 TaxID=3140790 RepID=UPI003AF3FFC8